ncbi:MAG: hypothetical protein ACTSVV_19480 [Promethearchaeota archaeon]
MLICEKCHKGEWCPRKNEIRPINKRDCVFFNNKGKTPFKLGGDWKDKDPKNRWRKILPRSIIIVSNYTNNSSLKHW